MCDRLSGILETTATNFSASVAQFLLGINLAKNIIASAYGSIGKLNDCFESKNPMTPVFISARLIALFIACLLVGQSVMPLAAFGAIELRGLSEFSEAADILGVRSNVDRILELQAAGGEPTEELLWNKTIVLRQLLLGYLEVRQTSDLLDEAIDDTYDAIDKQVRTVNRRVELANIANFTTFGVIFNIGAAERLSKRFNNSNYLTFVGAGLTAGIGAAAVALSYSGASKDRTRPNPLANIFGLDTVSVPLPELVSKYINATPKGKTQSRRQAMLDLWKTEFGLKEAITSREILAAESAKPHRASVGLLNKRLALLFSLNALAEEFDSELLALLRSIESTSVPTQTTDDSAVANQIGASGAEAARLLQVEKCAAVLIHMKEAGASNGADLRAISLDLYVLEKILGAAFEVRQLVDRIDREKHYQFDVLLPQLVRVRDRVNLLSNTANFTEIGVLKSIAGRDFVLKNTPAGAQKILIMDALSVAIANANFAFLKLYKRKQDSEINALANIFNFDVPSECRFSPLISSYLESVPPDSTKGMTRKQLLLERWKQVGRLSNKKGSAEALASMPSMHNKRVETTDLVNKRVEMLFDVSGAVETLDSELLQLLTAVILPAPENATENKIDKQLILTKRVLQHALEVRSASDQIDNQLSDEYTARGAILASRARGVQYNNILNFTQSGLLGIVSQGLVMKGKNNHANAIDLVAGSTVLLLSTVALIQARIGRRPSKPELNVLAQVLTPGAPSKESIPQSVRQYLNSPVAENGMTRRESLIERWKKSGVITTNLQNQRSFGRLSASSNQTRRETVQLISDRIVMLHDVKTTIESMDKHLVSALRNQ
ncbi:MAG: hypothetical protein C0507_12300 [Cyanobacteria bacterium PR.3.49]|nr:hypothetical protein [Cyanobacteria bacterium PR.3.49]